MKEKKRCKECGAFVHKNNTTGYCRICIREQDFFKERKKEIRRQYLKRYRKSEAYRRYYQKKKDEKSKNKKV